MRWIIISLTLQRFRRSSMLIFIEQSMPEQFIYSQKNNFSGGELTPTIEGRTELALYQNGARKLINFMLLPTGGIMRRHGTQFVHLFAENVPKKMVTVMFSRKLSYLLVFESRPLQTTCSFFVGGELFLTSKVLKDNGNDFHFRPQDFSYCCFQGVAYISFGINRPIFKFSVDPEIIERFDGYLAAAALDRQRREGTGAAIASGVAMQEAANFPDRERLFIIEPLKVHVNYFKIAASGGSASAPILRPFNEVIYNAEVDRINDELRDLHGRARENIHEHQQELLYCNCLATFENRLWCFGAGKNIHAIWASYKGDFADFRMAYKTLLEARNPLTAFSATFASSTFDNVLWSVPFSSEMLLGTTDGIYLVKEGDRAKGEFVKIHKEIEVPVSPIKPVVLGKTIFFVEGNNRKINSLFYSQEKGGFQIADITPYAEHIFADGIKEIAGSNSPFSIIFAVLKNGSFASFTYSQDLKIMGWSQHWLGGNGFVLAITPVYSDNEDKLYFHVRRSDETGGSKEYLEVLKTGYFSAKNPEMHKPVYADCHINVSKAEEQAASLAIKQALLDDSAVEFRGDLTKLEQLVQAQAENILKLNLANIDLSSSFRYKQQPLTYYGDQQAAIESFLRRYYQNYLPVIFETLAASFAYLRSLERLYSNLENVFCGEPEALSTAEQLLQDCQRLGGDISNNAERVIAHWQVPAILQDGGLMEYLPNSGFSFCPVICERLKLLNIAAIRSSLGIGQEIIRLAKSAISQPVQAAAELQEMRGSVAKLNQALLQYYAKEQQINKQPLLANLKKFFSRQPVNFYSQMLAIAHPILTRYLTSHEAKSFIEAATAGFTAATTQEQLLSTTRSILRQLLTRLEQIYNEHKIDSIISSKRRQELSDLLKAVLAAANLSPANKQYVLSSAFSSQTIDEVLEHYEFAGSDGAVGAAGQGEHSDGSVAGDVHSENDEEEITAQRVANLMLELKNGLSSFRQHLIDYCQLVMPQYHPVLLKNILEDEKSLKLEKYLLLSRKYFPVFKKLFPEIGAYQLSLIAQNCQPAFHSQRVAGILPIFQHLAVSIIGDEELQELKILDSEEIKLKHPARHLAIGFPYSSVLQTFPFIFPDEVEHMPKLDVQFGVKVFNTKGGYIEQKNESGEVLRQHINNLNVASDQLVRFSNEKKYLATKEVCSVLATPHRSGWIELASPGQVKTDVDFTFIVYKPYPASILKVYAKAKVLAGWRG